MKKLRWIAIGINWDRHTIVINCSSVTNCVGKLIGGRVFNPRQQALSIYL